MGAIDTVMVFVCFLVILASVCSNSDRNGILSPSFYVHRLSDYGCKVVRGLRVLANLSLEFKAACFMIVSFPLEAAAAACCSIDRVIFAERSCVM